MDAALKQQRADLLAEHVAAENDDDVDRVIATFRTPRYELVATGQVFDGEAEVRRYYTEKESRGRNHYEVLDLHFAESSVVVELRTTSVEPAGGPPAIDFRSIAVFEFDGPELTCERVYWDTAVQSRQLRERATAAG
jgi:hypothetical protein